MKDSEFEKEADLDELIRQNNGQDIEIEFYCNGKRIELNNSIYELIQEDRKEKMKQKDKLVLGSLPPKLKKVEPKDGES